MDGTGTGQFVHNLARNSPKLPTAQMVGFLLLVVGAVGVACTLAVFALLLLFPFWAGAELMFYLFLRARRREMQRVLQDHALLFWNRAARANKLYKAAEVQPYPLAGTQTLTYPEHEAEHEP